MKKVIFLAGIAAAALLAGCTKNEMTANTDQATFDSDVAYLVVNIQDVGSASTKGTSESANEGFEDGVEGEWAISTIDFYFYDSNGVFVTHASPNYDSGSTHNQSDVDVNNVTWDANTVIALSGLEGTAIPNWVVTVINKPDDFAAPTDLAEFRGALASESADSPEGYYKSGNYFVMSTSSFIAEDEYYPNYHSDDGAYWYATPVIESNFSLEPINGSNGSYTDANGNAISPVNIYVERLAVKVIVDVDETSMTNKVDTGVYSVTVNAEVNGGTGGYEKTTYYIKFDGWAINAVARESNMVKTIENTTTWNNTYFYTVTGTSISDDSETFSTSWNAPKFHRSYWGKSWNYGYGTEPTSSEGNVDSDEANNSGSHLDDYLMYTSLASGKTTDIGSSNYAYCTENTNTVKTNSEDEVNIISDKNSTALTSVLIKATLYSDAACTSSIGDMINADGVFYTVDDYLALCLNEIGDWYIGQRQVSVDDIEISDEYDGNVKVQLKEDYSEQTISNIDATVTYTYDEFNENVLDNLFNRTYGAYANGYKGGAMYYSIPIEHLNNAKPTDTDLVNMANYGVVRNHVYKLTVNSVLNIGRGIWNPDEVIIPQPEIQTYSLGCTIHVLAWKIVNQSVSL